MIKAEPSPRSSFQKTSLLIGVLAGLGYSLGTWGIESIVLSTAHGMYPFLKLLVGVLACGLVGLLAGWLCWRYVNVLVNVMVWAFTSAAFNRIAFYLNFPGSQAMLKGLQPKLGSILNYAIDYGVSTRGTLMLIITIIAGTLIGLFFSITFEAITSNDGIRRVFPMFFWAATFLAVGYLAAMINTNPMRDAVVSVNDSIQFAIEHSGEDLSTQVKSSMGLFGLDQIEPYLNSSYRLITSSYDKSLFFIQVLVQLEDQNAICPVINGSLGTCIIVEK